MKLHLYSSEVGLNPEYASAECKCCDRGARLGMGMIAATMAVHYSSKTAEWETPQWLFDRLNAEYRFTTDVCATPENAKCERFYTKETDGLRQVWAGACWMNPPYGDPEFACKAKCKKKKCAQRGYHIDKYVPGVTDFVKKAYTSACEGSATVVCLLPARTDTGWFHDYCAHGIVELMRGRLKFVGGKSSAPFPSMLVTFHAYLDPGGVIKQGRSCKESS